MKTALLLILASIAFAKARPEPPLPAGHRGYLPPGSEDNGVTQARFPEALPLGAAAGPSDKNDPFSYQPSPSRDYEAPDLEYGAPEPQGFSAPSQEYGAPIDGGATISEQQHIRVSASGARDPNNGAIRAQGAITNGNGAHGYTAELIVDDEQALSRGYLKEAPSNHQRMMADHERRAKNGSPAAKYAAPPGNSQTVFNRAHSSRHQGVNGAKPNHHQAPSNSYGPPTSRQKLPSNSYAASSSIRQKTPSNTYGAPFNRQQASPNGHTSDGLRVQPTGHMVSSKGHRASSNGQRTPTNSYEASTIQQENPYSRYGAPSSRHQAPTDGHHEAQANKFGEQSNRHQTASTNGNGARSRQQETQSDGAPPFAQQQEQSAEHGADHHHAPSARYGAPSHHQTETPVSGYAGPAQPSFGYASGSENGRQHVDSRADAEENSEEELPAKYKFDYKVQDEESGLDFGHQEEREGEEAKGEFRVLLPDGRTLIVAYTADEGGYHPEIMYEDGQVEGKSSSGLDGPY